MSIAVDLERLRAEAETRGPGAFLLTVTDDGRPHVVAVLPERDGEAALTMSAGRTSVRNAGTRPGATLLWPPAEPGGYSLIVDGEAIAQPAPDPQDGGHVTLQVTRAVLHRPAAGSPDDPDACGSDCVPLRPTDR